VILVAGRLPAFVAWEPLSLQIRVTNSLGDSLESAAVILLFPAPLEAGGGSDAAKGAAG
jgi:hypothetical protein